MAHLSGSSGVEALEEQHERFVVTLPAGLEPDWQALREHPVFLYARVADRGRSFLFVGERSSAAEPRFPNAQGVGFPAVQDWTYGHCCYDLKNELEALATRHDDPFGMPPSRWSVPRWVVEWRADGTLLHAHEEDLKEGLRFTDRLFHSGPLARDIVPLVWHERTDRARYLAQAARLMAHIQRGDIYEVNYCTARDAQAPGFDPFAAFRRLLRHTDAPFAAFHRLGRRFALCASPERFLAFEPHKVIGQPMKGTRPRSADPAEDARLAADLATDPKERGENIMALDVMRNDLSRIAAPRSVVVDELCVVRPHARVHQMTSTLSAYPRPGITPWQVVRAAFPMASMTGAPKIRAMQLIDEVEDQRRGLFSGTLGWFAPDGTGDLNVVIRTALHDAATGLTRLTTGSALTAACDPELEWEECQLKARSVMEALAP